MHEGSAGGDCGIRGVGDKGSAGIIHVRLVAAQQVNMPWLMPTKSQGHGQLRRHV